MSNNYYSDSAPCFKKATIKLNSIPAYQYDSNVAAEYKAKKITKAEVLEIYESMLTIREFEEMILKCRTGAYEIISDYDYRGPTHLSIGQEATAAGVCSVLNITDFITSTHRGHGHCIAKGAQLDRAMAELMGKATGYCKGRSGSMHIADFKAALGQRAGLVKSYCFNPCKRLYVV